jgi:hypothetical protein
VFHELVDPVVVVAQDVLDRFNIMTETALTDVENRLLSFVHHVRDLVLLVVRQGGDLAGRRIIFRRMAWVSTI